MIGCYCLCKVIIMFSMINMTDNIDFGTINVLSLEFVRI